MFKGTTVICVRKNREVCIAADGQVTLGHTVVKHQAKKVRRIYHGKVIVGFAGSTADAMTLFEKLEAKLHASGGNLTRAAVDLAKDWRGDKYLRRLEALMIAADVHATFLISGTGDVLKPDEAFIAIGSGGSYATAAAKALWKYSELNAQEMAREAISIAADICIYTNKEISMETLKDEGKN